MSATTRDGLDSRCIDDRSLGSGLGCSGDIVDELHDVVVNQRPSGKTVGFVAGSKAEGTWTVHLVENHGEMAEPKTKSIQRSFRHLHMH
jgi:hypothetical protein